MKKAHFLSYLILLILFLSCGVNQSTSTEVSWVNPIQKGINQYGMKDFFAFYEGETYYLVGTEYKNPFKGFLGPNLYKSTNLNSWEIAHKLIDFKNVPEKAWYKNGWFAPEIKKIKNKYYFTFNNRNDAENPYQKLGFGIAVSNSLYGNYKVLNPENPIVLGNHGSLVIGDNEDEIYVVYDLDARIYIAEIDIDNAKLKSEPIELLGPELLQSNYRFLDAPQITKIGKNYHMLFSQFYSGYVVKVFHMTAKHPTGPWKWSTNNPMYTFLEEEADEIVKNKYPTQHGYAPPTQVVFSNQLFKGANNNYFNVYHSSEKYSEPYLCIEPVKIKGQQLQVVFPKKKLQKIILR